jgi:hypothetical protein
MHEAHIELLGQLCLEGVDVVLVVTNLWLQHESAALARQDAMVASCGVGEHRGGLGAAEVAGVAGTPHGIFLSLATMCLMSCHCAPEAEEGKKD